MVQFTATAPKTVDCPLLQVACLKDVPSFMLGRFLPRSEQLMGSFIVFILTGTIGILVRMWYRLEDLSCISHHTAVLVLGG